MGTPVGTRSTITFWDGVNKCDLHPIAANSYTVENAGGKSEISEAHSMHYLTLEYDHNCEIVYETQVDYWCQYKMIDYIIVHEEQRTGVSVTRAMKYRRNGVFDAKEADRLMQKKLYGLVVARNAVNKRHRFFTCVLHVWCQTEEIALLCQQALESYPQEEQKGVDFSVIFTVCHDQALYTNLYP